MPVLPGSVTNGSDLPGNDVISHGKAISRMLISGENRQSRNPFFGENGKNRRWLRSRHRWNSKQCGLYYKPPDLQKSACLLEGQLPPKTPNVNFAKTAKNIAERCCRKSQKRSDERCRKFQKRTEEALSLFD